jgi:signal transduction histidine kinase
VAALAASPSREWNRVDPCIDPGGLGLLLEVDDCGRSLGYGYAVSSRSGFSSRLRGVETRLLDVLIISVGAWQQVWLWTAAHSGPRAVVVPAALVFAVSLLARDRRPLSSRLVSFAALAVWAGYAPHTHGSTISYFAGVLLDFWVAGTAPDPRDAGAGVGRRARTRRLCDERLPQREHWRFLLLDAHPLGPVDGRLYSGPAYPRAHLLQQRLAREQSEREARAQRAVTEERTRIARELHDVVAHSLSVAIIQTVAATGELSVSERAGEVGRHLRAVESACRDALTDAQAARCPTDRGR